MELRDIEYFTVVAEHGHLGRAADVLGLSQPALSKSLRRLEDALQVKLFRRSHRGLQLTAEGSALLPRTRELQVSLKNIARELSDVSKGRVGHLRIGIGPIVPGHLIVTACASLFMEAPRTTMEVIVSDADEIIPALRKGDIDVIVNIMHPTSPEGLRYAPLYEEDFVVCSSSRHKLSRKQSVTFADLSEERWASSGALLPTYQRLRDALGSKGFPAPQIAFESRSSWLRLEIVSSSTLLVYTSRSLVHAAKAAGYPLVILPVAELVWRRPIGAIIRTDGYLPPAAQLFVDALKAASTQAEVRVGTSHRIQEPDIPPANAQIVR